MDDEGPVHRTTSFYCTTTVWLEYFLKFTGWAKLNGANCIL